MGMMGPCCRPEPLSNKKYLTPHSPFGKGFAIINRGFYSGAFCLTAVYIL